MTVGGDFPEEGQTISFAFACVMVSWEVAIPCLARYYESFSTQDGPGVDGFAPGVISDARAYGPFGSYGHDTETQGDFRIRMLRGDPDWVYLEPGGGGTFAHDQPLNMLAEVANAPVFEVMYSVTMWRDLPHKYSSLRIRSPSEPLRLVECGWEYDPPGAGNAMRRRNNFTHTGPVHPAENVDAYSNRRIAERLNEAELCAFIHRIGAEVPTQDTTERALIFSILGTDTPLEPIDTLLDRLPQP